MEILSSVGSSRSGCYLLHGIDCLDFAEDEAVMNMLGC
jgi:hypothetical protein